MAMVEASDYSGREEDKEGAQDLPQRKQKGVSSRDNHSQQNEEGLE